MKRVSLVASFFVAALFLVACEDPDMDQGGGMEPTEQQDF